MPAGSNNNQVSVACLAERNSGMGIAIGSTLRRGGLVPAPEAEQPFTTIISRLNSLLRELDRRKRPAPGMAADGNSLAVVLVERDSFRGPHPSAAEDHGLAGGFGLGLLLANVRFARPLAFIRGLYW
jgi:hypothetical protein